MKDNRKKIFLITLIIIYSPIIFWGVHMIIKQTMSTSSNHTNIVSGSLAIIIGLLPFFLMSSIFLIQYIGEKINFIKEKKIEENGEVIIADFAGLTRKTYH